MDKQTWDAAVSEADFEPSSTIACIHGLLYSHLPEFWGVLVPEYCCERWRKGERHTLALYAEFLLSVIQEMAKVDMKQFAVASQHNVVIVTVSNAQNIPCAKSKTSKE